MGKLKHIKSENIINYLNNSNITLNNEWVKNIAIADIVVLYLAMISLENKLIYGIIFSITNIIVAVSLVYYLKKIEHSKKNIFLFSGIYTCHLSLCLTVLVYSLIRRVAIEWSLFLFLILLVVNILIAMFTIIVQVCKIYKNHYCTKSLTGGYVIGGAAVAGACFARTLKNISPLYVLSACVAGCSICFATSSHMLLRYYCCVILENREEKA